MRKIFVFLIAFMAVTLSYAQGKKNIIKTNPLGLALTNINLGYERFISDKVSIQLHGGYLLGYSREGYKFDSYSATPEVRFYLTDNDRPKGFFVAPFGRYESYNFTDKNTNSKAKLTRMGGGVVAGYQFKLGNTVTWDISGGPRYVINNIDGDPDGVLFNNNFGFRFATTFGVAF